MQNYLERALLFSVLLPLLHIDVSSAQRYSANIALNKTASQSSTEFDQWASLAVDGNENPSNEYLCSSTRGGSSTSSIYYNWWQVDLGDIYEVTSITFYSSPGYFDYLANIDVFVGNDNVNVINQTICLSIGSESGIPPRGNKTFNCSSKAVGRFITLMKKTTTELIICEFEATGNFIGSSDPDECSDNNGNCSVYATCNNTDVGYNCSCFEGFIGDGFNCTDVNECQYNSGNCNPNADCTNIAGSFHCNCKAGFVGDGFNCSEIDECLNNNGGCDKHATCNNTVGNFQCTCQAGYIGDGFSCKDQTAGAGNPTSKCLRRLKRCRICRRSHGNSRCRRRCRC